MSALTAIDTTEVEVARELIKIQDEIAALKRAEAVCKTMLRVDGPRSFTVDDHRVTVTAESERTSTQVDWETVAKKAGASRQLITAHTSVKATKVSPTIRVYGPKTS